MVELALINNHQLTPFDYVKIPQITFESCYFRFCMLFQIFVYYFCYRTNEFSDSRIEAISHIPTQIQETCTDRKLTLSDRSLPLIAIASFPESGAEWVQDLLQKITGNIYIVYIVFTTL